MIQQSYTSKVIRNESHLPYVFGKKTQNNSGTLVLGTPPKHTPTALLPDNIPMPRDRIAATKRKMDIAVYMARDRIVRTNAANCPFKPGELVMPRNPQDRETFGRCRIINICSCYYDFGNDEEWPESNVPRIILFESEEPNEGQKNKHFFGTINFFEKDSCNVC